MNKLIPDDYGQFLADLKVRIRQAQYQALRAANKELLQLYWDIGESILRKQEEVGWGKVVVETLARDLQAEFPGRNGFSARNLWNMRDLYREYSSRPKLQPLVAEISWSKNLIIMVRCNDDLEREFYLRATARFGWSKDVLIHRRLRCLVAIELKIGAFEPEHKGKMEFYLEALDRQERLPEENAPIGIIICRDKNKTVVEYALSTASRPIGVATYTIVPELPEAYRAELPSPEAIAERLQAWSELEASDE